MVEPAVAARALRRRARARRLQGLVGERSRDRRVVLGAGSRRVVPAGGFPRDLDDRGAGRGDRRDPGGRRGSGPGPVVALDADGVRARCSSPRFRRGLYVPDDATVQPARLALGLRRRLLERGAAVYEHSRVRALEASSGEVVARTDGARMRAGAGVLTINAATRGVRPLRSRLSVTSSHIVLTEPVPDVLEAARLDRGRVDHRRPHVPALLPDDPRRPHPVRLGRRAARARRPARRPNRGRPAGRRGGAIERDGDYFGATVISRRASRRRRRGARSC